MKQRNLWLSLAAIVAVCAFTFTLAACGSDDDDDNNGKTDDTVSIYKQWKAGVVEVGFTSLGAENYEFVTTYFDEICFDFTQPGVATQLIRMKNSLTEDGETYEKGKWYTTQVTAYCKVTPATETTGTIALGDKDNVMQYTLTKSTLTLRQQDDTTITLQATSGVQSSGMLPL